MVNLIKNYKLPLLRASNLTDVQVHEVEVKQPQSGQVHT
ncbi:hypothetical protein COO91_05260 [Nostoc flagelliforme CCNUN1]|uniref:Uncharacterized protein n=1 Tax=Nostoc flagelliforme CCNUN1 TaxID=2038116 RepID=A0A2K8SV33_9NOSO|nr:hypothetical protein COO91_05260 [Nostoc flagelliforme CCNUN1]